MNQDCQGREDSNDGRPTTVENGDGFPKSAGRRLMPQLWRSGLFLIHQHKLRPGAHRLSNYALSEKRSRHRYARSFIVMGIFKPATSDGGVSAAVWANGCGYSSLRGCCWSPLSVPTWEKLR